jgi:glutamate synthase domain-containing protein 3
MVDLDTVESGEDIGELLQLIENHKECTGSTVAARLLDDWPNGLKNFIKVMPRDYKRVLAERKQHDEEIESGGRKGRSEKPTAVGG